MQNITERVCEYLESEKIEYEIVFHNPAFTIEECKEIEKLICGKICKNLFLTTETHSVFYLLMLSGEKRFVTKEISKKLGTSRLSFASADNMREMLITSPGSLSVTSLIFDSAKRVQVAIDKDLLEEEYFCCHPSCNTATLRIKTKDLTERFLPSVGADPTIIDV